MSVGGATEPININAKCFSPFDIDSIRIESDLEHVREQVYSSSPENLRSLKEIITGQLEQDGSSEF